jgi:small subunit ribosomal protein S9
MTEKSEKIKTKKEKTIKPKAAKKEKAVLEAVVEFAPEPAPAVEPEAVGEEGDKEGKPRKYYEAVGRRKSAIARVRLFTKGSEIFVNGRPCENYFSIPELRQIVEAPFRKMKNFGKFRTEIKVVGGGLKGQAEAVRHGISRALTGFNVDFRKRLKKAGYLTRDARVKERRKYGLKKARRAPQWAKR